MSIARSRRTCCCTRVAWRCCSAAATRRRRRLRRPRGARRRPATRRRPAIRRRLRRPATNRRLRRPRRLEAARREPAVVRPTPAPRLRAVVAPVVAIVVATLAAAVLVAVAPSRAPPIPATRSRHRPTRARRAQRGRRPSAAEAEASAATPTSSAPTTGGLLRLRARLSPTPATRRKASRVPGAPDLAVVADRGAPPQMKDRFLPIARRRPGLSQRQRPAIAENGRFLRRSTSRARFPEYTDGKHLYGNSFVLYALAAAYQATGDPVVLAFAKRALHWIDEHGDDAQERLWTSEWLSR